MSEPKFTPGPWVPDRHPTSEWEVYSLNEEDGGHVAWAGGGIGEVAIRCEADAHLIAAAPDLYAALELLVENVSDMGGCPGLAEARAALAKARGESK